MLADAASVRPEKRSADQQASLDRAFRDVHPDTSAITKQISTVQKKLDDLKKAIVATPIMRDLPKNRYRETHIHVRGNFLEKGDAVEVGFPAAFEDTDISGSDRRAVAEWLMSSSNPLTARVTVNRVWGRIFGRGLVETEEDFGTQGTLPTHPQLLDWLAVEFRDAHRWSFKQLCRTIVMSSTYQQSSVANDQSKELDPQNRWLSRGARFRLPAEAVRDQALAISGLLSDRIGGPSVMPPQPDGIWKATYSKLKWQTATGEDRYRRGIYVFLRRTSPYPSMITFDGTSREVCQIRRIRTNTPLQALILLNDPVYLESAGALARSVLEFDTNQQLQEIFRRVVIRPATDAEFTQLKIVYDAAMDQYDHADESDKLLKAANLTADDENRQRLAALTLTCSVVLNLDETISRQ